MKYPSIRLFLISLLLVLPYPSYIYPDVADEDSAAVDEAVKIGKPINIGELKIVSSIPMPKSFEVFLKKLVIAVPKVTKNSDGSKITAGQVSYNNFTLQVELRTMPKKGGGNGIAITVGLPDGFQASQIDDRLAPLDTISLARSALIFSTGTYTDTQWKMDVEPGVNFFAAVRGTGVIEKLTRPLGEKFNEVDIQGLVTLNLVGSYLKATLPGVIRIAKLAQSTGVSLVVRFGDADVTIGLESGFSVNLPGQAEPLGFKGSVAFKNTEFIINMWMENYVKNIFGIQGLQFGKATILVGSDIAQLAQSEGLMPISSLGIGGSIKVGPKEFTAIGLVDISKSSPEFLLIVDFPQGLSIEDVALLGVYLANDVYPISNYDQVIATIKRDVPSIGLKKARLRVVPSHVVISGKNYYRGMSVEGLANVLDTNVQFLVDITEKEVTGAASLTTKIGPVLITGSGIDQKKGTSDDAAIVTVTVDPSKGTYNMDVNGTVTIEPVGSFPGMAAAARLSLGKTNMAGAFDFNLYNMYSAKISVGAKSAPAPAQPAADAAADAKATPGPAGTNMWSNLENWSFGVDFKQEGLSALGALIKKLAGVISAKAEADLSRARNNVKGLDDQIDAIDPQIADLNAKIDARVQQNLRAIAKAQEKVNSLKAVKDKLDNQVRECKGKKPKFSQEADQFAKGAALTPDQVKAAVEQLRQENPDMPQEAIDAALQALAAQFAAGQIQ